MELVYCNGKEYMMRFSTQQQEAIHAKVLIKPMTWSGLEVLSFYCA